MKNITITLDPETAKWVRVKAAEQNMSVSRFVGEVLQQQMKDRLEYQRAMQSFLSKPALTLGEPGEPLPKRAELYDRPRLR
jgi:ribosomal protein S3